MSSPNWAPVFGITENDLADLENHLAAQDYPLRWLLENGHIESSAYVQWARDQYGLPSLNDSFFEVPADLVYWEAVKHQFKWTSTFFPLAEWQGVMLIGCLEPPNFHFPIHSPHRFVIASAHALEHRFRELEPQAVPHKIKQTAPQAIEHAPVVEEEIPPSHAPSAPDHDQDQEIEFATAEPVAHVRQRPSDEVLADSLPPAPDVDMRDPDGLVFDVDSSSNINFTVPDGMQVEDLGKPIPTTPDGFDEVSRITEMSDFSDDVKPDGLSASTVPPKAVAAPPKAAPPAAPKYTPPPVAAIKKPEPVLQAVAPVEPPPRAPIVPPGPPAAVVKAAAEKVVMPPVPPPAPTAIRSNVSSTEPAVPLTTCTSVDSLMAAAVANICVQFEHAMVLNYDNAVLKPAKWSELLLSIKGDNPDAVSLDQASIFRVAARTSLPYHGYVVSNPTNATFFNSFNRGQIPKHCTIMPVMIAGQLTAMLMGISNETIDFKGTLNSMEKLASDFSAQLERLREKQQAA
jgi:hypothetical protein